MNFNRRDERCNGEWKRSSYRRCSGHGTAKRKVSPVASFCLLLRANEVATSAMQMLCHTPEQCVCCGFHPRTTRSRRPKPRRMYDFVRFPDMCSRFLQDTHVTASCIICLFRFMYFRLRGNANRMNNSDLTFSRRAAVRHERALSQVRSIEKLVSAPHNPSHPSSLLSRVGTPSSHCSRRSLT